MTGIGDLTTLRGLAHLQELGLMIKTGQLKGTRYHLNVPHVIAGLKEFAAVRETSALIRENPS